MSQVPLYNLCPFVRYVRPLSVPSQVYKGEVIACDCRLFCGRQGTTRITLENQSVELSPGMVLILPPATFYTISSGDSHPAALLAINFDYTWANSDKASPIPPQRREDFDIRHILGPFYPKDIPLLRGPLLIRATDAVQRRILSMLEEYRSRKKYFSCYLSAQMQQLLIDVVRQAAFPAAPDTCHDIGKQIIDYLHAHFNQPLKYDDIGRQFNYHPNYVNTLVVQLTGRSLHRYLTDIRIARAISLLESTTETITQIAGEVGYGDAAHFSKLFKKLTGRTPGQYRLP